MAFLKYEHGSSRDAIKITPKSEVTGEIAFFKRMLFPAFQVSKPEIWLFIQSIQQIDQLATSGCCSASEGEEKPEAQEQFRIEYC